MSRCRACNHILTKQDLSFDPELCLECLDISERSLNEVIRGEHHIDHPCQGTGEDE